MNDCLGDPYDPESPGDLKNHLLEYHMDLGGSPSGDPGGPVGSPPKGQADQRDLRILLLGSQGPGRPLPGKPEGLL